MDNKSVGGLVITEDVIAKMASVAALEIEGVACLVNKPTDLKGLFKNSNTKAVRVVINNSVINIDIHLSVKDNVKITKVAEAVQKNVKTTVQNMTGSAVTKINVYIDDVEIDKITDKAE